jgi:CDP-6-deoxy-D-xylo-4-hexulose-3-dehydrase
MVLLEHLMSQIKMLVKKYFEDNQSLLFTNVKYKIPLSVPSFSWEEVTEAIDSLLSTRLTMGEKVKSFEDLFAKYIGSKEAIMVNSGSSANLIALSILSNPILGENAIKTR